MHDHEWLAQQFEAGTDTKHEDGTAGLVWAPGGRPRVAFNLTITHGRIVAIDLVAEPERLAQLDVRILGA